MLRFGPFLGVSTKSDPAYLKPEYLQYALDVDFSTGAIVPLRTDRLVEPAAVGQTIFLENCCLKWYPNCVNITRDTRHCGRIFATGIQGKPYPVNATPDDWCADDLCRLGWPCLTVAPEVSYGATPVSDKAAEARAYVYTYINKFGEESPPSPPSPTVLVDYSEPATLAGFQEIPPEYCAVRLKIYALVAGISNAAQASGADADEYFEVANLPANTLVHIHAPLNTVTGNMLMTDRFASIPDDATDFNHWGGTQMTFLSDGLVKFTEPWNYSVAPPKYFYKPKFAPLRLLASQNTAYVLTCSSPEVIDLKNDCNQGGCHTGTTLGEKYPLIGRQSPALHMDSVVFASVEGLAMISGATASVITSDIFTQAQWDEMQPHTMRGVVHNGYYYGATDTTTFRLELPGSGKTGVGEKLSFLSIRPTAWYSTSDNRLLYSDSTGTHEVGQGDAFKTYRATTKKILMHRSDMLGAMYIHSGCGDVKITQWSGSRACIPHTYTLNTEGSWMARLPRFRANEFTYEIEGTAPITSIAIGKSFAELAT